jgi:TRAP-type C4-dicarboxylate transport system substrate-binding protein
MAWCLFPICSPAEWRETNPLFGVVTLPFLIQSFQEGKVLNDIARPYFDKAAEKWNQKILYISPWPAAGFWTKKEIKSVADMKGIKMRTYDKNGALVVQAVGGTPYPLPFSEVYSALATGVIDSVLTSTPHGGGCEVLGSAEILRAGKRHHGY